MLFLSPKFKSTCWSAPSSPLIALTNTIATSFPLAVAAAASRSFDSELVTLVPVVAAFWFSASIGGTTKSYEIVPEPQLIWLRRLISRRDRVTYPVTTVPPLQAFKLHPVCGAFASNPIMAIVFSVPFKGNAPLVFFNNTELAVATSLAKVVCASERTLTCWFSGLEVSSALKLGAG